MKDMKGIFTEYLPLQIVSVGDVYASDDLPEAWLNEYDFDWRPLIDGSVESEDTPRRYLGDTTMTFGVEDNYNKASVIKQKLNGEKLRLPKISACWGDKSLMLSNELAGKLRFSPILGVTKTEAIIIDAAGEKRSGFTALSFHKSFFHDRVTKRLNSIDAVSRPIIKVQLKGHTHAYFIHKSVLENWQLAGIDDVRFDVSEQHQSFNYLCNAEMYFGSGGTRCFKTLEDYQANRGGEIWGDDLDFERD